jgi:hypothetical protein
MPSMSKAAGGMYDPSTLPSAASQIRQRRSRCDSGATRTPPIPGGGPGRMSGEPLTIAWNARSSFSQRLSVLTPTPPARAASGCVLSARRASAARWRCFRLAVTYRFYCERPQTSPFPPTRTTRMGHPTNRSTHPTSRTRTPDRPTAQYHTGRRDRLDPPPKGRQPSGAVSLDEQLGPCPPDAASSSLLALCESAHLGHSP